MKVVIVAQAFLPFSGGSAVSEASLCSAMTKKCDLTILCREGAVDYAFSGNYGLRDIKEYRPADVFAAWKDPKHWLRGLFKDVEVCHLNGHWRWEDHFFARLCRQMHIPYVMQPRGMLLLGHRRVALKRAFNLLLGNWSVSHAQRLIALSHFEERQFAPYSVKPGAVVVLPNGISHIGAVSADSVAGPVLDLCRQRPYYLYFGRLEARKNLLFLVEVFSDYVKRGGECSLLLMGPVERGYDEKIGALIQRLGVGERVKILRPLFDASRWYVVNQARGVVYPTLEEPFGRVPFEALSAGTLPIVPDQSGSSEYLRSVIPQCIYEHQNAVSLLSVFNAFDSLGKEERERRVHAGRDWVHAELDWENIATQLYRIYEGILPGARTRQAS